MVDAYTSFLSALEVLEKHDVCYEILEAFDTLLVYCYNLYSRPEETKFHFISAVNIHFQERLGHLNGSVAAMDAIGYRQVNSVYQYDQTLLRSEVLASTKDTLSRMIQHLEARRTVFHTTFLNGESIIPPNHTYSSVKGAGYAADRGRRATMEDSECIVDGFFDTVDTGFFAVYDGHGGRDTVDFIARTLHVNVASQLRSYGYVPKRFARSDKQLDDEVIKEELRTLREVTEAAYKQTDAQLRRSAIIRSGSTTVTCLINYLGNKRFLTVANVGDSRAVLCRDNVPIRLTVDHKASLPEEMERVAEAGGFITPNHRVNGVLAITRALGDHLLKDNEVVTYRPHFEQVELTKQDTLMILACDGLWDVITDSEAMDIALEVVARECATAAANRGLDADAFLTQELGPGSHKKASERVRVGALLSGEAVNRACVAASKRLIDEALRRHTNDNVTAMVILL